MPALQLPRMPVASDPACIKIGDCTVRAAHPVTAPCYTSFLASTGALHSISMKYTIVFDQYVGLGPSSGSTEFSALHLVNIIIILKKRELLMKGMKSVTHATPSFIIT